MFLAEEQRMRKFSLILCNVALGVLLVSSSAMAVSLQMVDGSDSDATVTLKTESGVKPWYNTGSGFKELLSATVFDNGAVVDFALQINETIVETLAVNLSNPSEVTKGVYSQDAFRTIALGTMSGEWLSTVEVRVDNHDGVAAVPNPEPASVLLLGGTLVVGFGFLRRKLRR
jgi:hypothetical protein